ncbi:MAG: hypothetical protein HY721_01660 [Planctomycetes bacterium]|nr:hypothetical protein [Planctomycetota bacterium]
MDAPRRLARPAGAAALVSVVSLASLAALPGCRIDILRLRGGNPIDREKFEKLEVLKTTRAEAVDQLGAPEKVEWKSGRDFLWYLYGDTVDTGVRFQFPPFRSFFGYQHTFLRMNEKSEDVDAMQLVFDESGVLEQKSLRLAESRRGPVGPGSGSGSGDRGWRLHVGGYFDHSLRLQGDGGVADYDKLFKNGFRTGVTVGWQPVPAAMFLVGASYQEYQGDAVRRSGSRIALDDLQLWQGEVGIRLSAPLSLLYELADFEEVKKVLFTEDFEAWQGLRFYVQGTTGGTYNANLPVKVDGVRRGNFYDRGAGFSGTLEGGIEYAWSFGTVHAGVLYQSLDAFDEGASSLDDRGDAFQALLVGGGASLKF